MTRIVWAIVAAVVALAAAIVWRAERVLGPPDTEFRYTVVVPAHESLAVIERIWRARLEGRDVRVERGAGRDAAEVEVAIRGAPRAHAAALARALDRRGAIEMRWVVSDTETARAWFRAIRSDRDAAPAEVMAYVDGWNIDGGGAGIDYFLVGPDRDTILAALAERAPAAPVPDDLALMVEALTDSSEVRTYLVEREPFVRASDVVAAAAEEDAITRNTTVRVTLSRDASARFAAATERHRGEKCAFILDGVIVAAPVVQGVIRGGRLGILSAEDADAEVLAATLRGGVLPPGIQARLIAAAGHDRSVWPVRLAIAMAAFVAAFVVGPWVRRRLPMAPLGHRAALGARWLWWPPAAGLLVTSAVLAVLWYVRWTILPGFSDEFVDATVTDRTHTAIASVHVLTLGLAPYLTAVLLVELVAMLAPRWRARRLGTAADRRPIDGAVVALTVILSIVQAVWLVRFFDSVVGYSGEVMIAEGLLPRVLMIGALLGGVALSLGGAALISRYGLGNGVLIIAAAGAIERQVTESPWESATSRGDALALFVVVAVGAGVLARLRLRGARLPWAGLAPALVTTAVLAALVAFVDSVGAVTWLRGLDRTALGWPATIVAVAALGLSLWPRRRAMNWIGGVISISAVLALLALLIHGPSLPWPLSLASAVLVGGAVVELCAGAWRCASMVRPMPVLVVHDVERADRASDRLAHASIPHAITGVHARALLRFLAAYCPITISVAAADVQAATAALAADP